MTDALQRSGRHAATTADLPYLYDAARRADVEVHRIGRLLDRDDLHARWSASFSFPTYYGANFDALLDCLRDLSWRTPAALCVVLGPLDSLTSVDPEATEELRSVMDSVSQWWAHTDQPFVVYELNADA